MAVLQALRDEIKGLRNRVRRIHRCSTASVSLVAADGGNNQIRFDPFLVQVVRVVDSNNNAYCVEAVTPSTDIFELGRAQFGDDGVACTPLGEMMAYLGVGDLSALSPMIRPGARDRAVNPGWVRAYRELIEWAVLFHIVCTRDFATDTIIVRDGLLRSMCFAGDLFTKLRSGFDQRIKDQLMHHNRRIYLAGVAKHSKVLDRYRLAMFLENVLATPYPAYVEVPREIEERAYTRSEYARGNDTLAEGEPLSRVVAGKMFLAKFGARPADPVWPVDVFDSQVANASEIIGGLLTDAIDGFPVPSYPLSLQRAHNNAALVDFDFDVIQDLVFDSIRRALGSEASAVDEFQLRDSDPAAGRY